MSDEADPISVEAAVPAANPPRLQATRLPLQRAQATRPFGDRSGQALPLQLSQSPISDHRSPFRSRLRTNAFTLAELVVTVGVLVLLVLLFTQLLKSAATVTTLGHKQMDADSQTRQLLDRMAIDFAQMVKRSDVDYYVKSSAIPPPTGVRNLLWSGNDRIAFYSTVPGYYPSTGLQSPVSLVAYRVNAQNHLERMGKGLVWNAVSTTDTPVVFMPIPVASPIPLVELPNPAPNPLPTPAWPNVDNLSVAPTPDPNTEVVGSQVFRFEYYYLLKGQADPTTSTTYAPILSDIPWDTRINSCCATAGSTLCCHVAPRGMRDVAAVVVDIAVIDPKSKVLLTDAQIATLTTPGNANFLADYSSGMTPGQLRTQWQNTVNAITTLPRPALSGIRFYERYFYLSPPTLLTP